jgi:citrate lyase subunit beta/citryl-CoA lyase
MAPTCGQSGASGVPKIVDPNAKRSPGDLFEIYRACPYSEPVTRSILYVPGDRPSMLEKAARRGADLLILDLEDAVPMASKADARVTVRDALPVLRDQGAKTAVRINSLAAEREADLAAITGVAPDAIVIAKATTAAVAEVAAAVDDVPLIPLIESARGLLDVPEIATHPRVVNLAIGEADLGADIGMSAGDADEAWTPSRLRVVWAAAAAGLPGPVGPVYVDISDLHGLRRSTERLHMLGFGGRSAVHPNQVGVINEVFTPSPLELQEARSFVASYDDAVAGGRGVILDANGLLVDEAVVRHARQLIADNPG